MDMKPHSNLDRLAVEFARMLNVDAVGLDASFSELGADSMLVVEVSLAAEEIYGITIDLEAIELHGEMTLREFDAQITPLVKKELECR
jgi:acyl carrier protein